MRIAILDAFSGIAGDMILGALLEVGLDPDWLRGLPARLSLEGVGVRIERVRRGDISCSKVDFDIPPQPHGRHIHQIRELVARSDAPPSVRERADRTFTAIAEAEGQIHGVAPERVHLHEVGAVDAILDVVGSIWGLEQIGVDRVYCGPLTVGDGSVRAAHGVLPVPAPATLKLLEGQAIRPGPEGSGELVTPTGAALVRILSAGAPPAQYVPLRSGFGAGTKEFAGRANALRIVLADAADDAAPSAGTREQVVLLSSDIDDMDAESLAGAAEELRQAGALDVILIPTIMKKGRPGARLEVLTTPKDAEDLEAFVLQVTTSLGVRRMLTERRVLAREMQNVSVLGHAVGVKVAVLPDGSRRGKPEFDDVTRVARASSRSLREIADLARAAAERA
ncbi:MAG: nickel pincer cofactor biosynthesis protein LarC [Gemmatimonadaceae bacterium]